MDFLLEVGCEEIPARFISPALADIERQFRAGLTEARLEGSDGDPRITTLGTPRRLVLQATGLPERQADLDEEILGPRVEVAFDAEGQPTKACQGFARSKGIEVDALMRIETAKGEVVGLRRQIAGLPAGEVLGPVIGQVLAALHFPKTMRWGLGEHAFARPVHWLLVLLDDAVLELDFAGQRSGRQSRGHRFAAPESFDVGAPGEYRELLEQRKVMTDPVDRRELIDREARRLATEAGGRLVEDEGLLDEIAYLTEYPVPLLGRFDKRFLEVPRQVLVAAMRNHQRYFSIENPDGTLLDAFVAVGNTPVDDPGPVRHGNERVLTARLADAEFFYQTDQKTTPVDLVPDLQDMLFQADLGSYYDKAIRVANLAVLVAHCLGMGGLKKIPRVIEALTVKTGELVSDEERFSWQIGRAALLAKTDLLTEMVGEFPELQGDMGGDYAHLAGESELVSEAIREQYRPRFANDEPPTTAGGAILSIADRLDTLVGCFGVGLKPTGTADPYALRRACLGIIAIVLQGGHHLSLRTLLDAAIGQVRDKVAAARLAKAQAKARKVAARKKKEVSLPTEVEPFEAELMDELLKFFAGRLRGRLTDGAPTDVVDAVLAAGMDDLAEVKLRVDALAAFARMPAFADLAVAFKRVANIIKDFECAELDPGLFAHDEERELYEVYTSITATFDELVDARQFDAALELLASRLREPVDRFFEAVLVNDPDDPARQANRKSLLAGIGMLFGRIADFSRLQTREQV